MISVESAAKCRVVKRGCGTTRTSAGAAAAPFPKSWNPLLDQELPGLVLIIFLPRLNGKKSQINAMFIKRGGVCWVVEANLSPVTNPPNPAALRSLWGHIPVGLGMPRMPWADLDSPSELPWDHLQKICWISTLCSGLWPCGVWGKGSFLQSLLSFLSLF